MADRRRRPSGGPPPITFSEYEARARREQRRKEAARQLRYRRISAVSVILIVVFGAAAVIGYLAEGGGPSPAGNDSHNTTLAQDTPHHSKSVNVTRTVTVQRNPSVTTLTDGPTTTTAKTTTVGPVKQHGADALKPGAAASFASFQRTQPGEIGIAVQPVGGGRETTLGDDAPAHGWSTTKPLVLAALMKATDADGGLNATEKDEATTAITISDNQSILDLFGDLSEKEGGALGAAQDMDSLLRSSGDDQTVVATSTEIPAGAATTFGQTMWAPSGAAKFYAALGGGCLLNAVDMSYILGLMQRIEPSESWGLGEAGLKSVAFKGGWGPENGDYDLYLVRQSGIVALGTPQAVAVSIVAHPPSSSQSFTIGTSMVTATARWLAGQLAYTSFGSGCGLVRAG